jgi:hypothetical protein
MVRTWNDSVGFFSGARFMFCNKGRFKKVGVGLMLIGVAACGQAPDKTVPGEEDVFNVANIQALAGVCTFDGSGNVSFTVADNETAYLFKRAADNMVVVNTSTDCTFASTKKITINASGSTSHKVILDYVGGTFGMATAVNSANTVIALGSVSGTNTVAIRGSANLDVITFGTAGAMSYATFASGTSGTVAPAARTYPDISMTGVTDVMAYGSGGNDIITGQGGTAVGATVAVPVGALNGNITMTVYGGNGDDTITTGLAGTGVNKLYGEAGNDLFLQQAVSAKDVIDGTNSGGASDTDTVDYSARSAALTVTLGDAVAASGAVGSILSLAKTNYSNNDSFTINNGTTPTVFEYKKVAMGFSATMGRTVIDITADTTDVEVAARTVTAINGVMGVGVTAAPDSTPGNVVITHATVGLKPMGSAITAGTLPMGATVTDFNAGVAFVGANDGASGEQDSIGGDIENVIGGSANDSIDASLATGSAHVLSGMTGNDTLIGSSLADTIYGGPGNDTLRGGALGDTLNGGDGDDAMQGGTGDDSLDGGGLNCVAASSAVCTTAYATRGAGALNPGINTIDYSERSATVTVDLTHLAAMDQVGEAGEHDSIVAASIYHIRGGSGDDALTGDGNANLIWGGGGIDTINGGAGNDALYGEAGADVINGQAGDDYISGGVGTNTIDGGDGNDFIDNSAGTAGTVDCGAGATGGDADGALLDGGETGPTPNNCEL